MIGLPLISWVYLLRRNGGILLLQGPSAELLALELQHQIRQHVLLFETGTGEVKDMATSKSNQVWTVADAQANLPEVLRLAETQVGSLAVKQPLEVQLL